MRKDMASKHHFIHKLDHAMPLFLSLYLFFLPFIISFAFPSICRKCMRRKERKRSISYVHTSSHPFLSPGAGPWMSPRERERLVLDWCSHSRHPLCRPAQLLKKQTDPLLMGLIASCAPVSCQFQATSSASFGTPSSRRSFGAGYHT